MIASVVVAGSAAIDCLVHHSVILELNLASDRLDESKKGKDSAD